MEPSASSRIIWCGSGPSPKNSMARSTTTPMLCTCFAVSGPPLLRTTIASPGTVPGAKPVVACVGGGSRMVVMNKFIHRVLFALTHQVSDTSQWFGSTLIDFSPLCHAATRKVAMWLGA